jgi:hypothetical protein
MYSSVEKHPANGRVICYSSGDSCGKMPQSLKVVFPIAFSVPTGCVSRIQWQDEVLSRMRQLWNDASFRLANHQTKWRKQDSQLIRHILAGGCVSVKIFQLKATDHLID